MGVIAGRKEMESQSLFQQKVLCNPKTGEPYEVWTVSQSLFQQKVLCNKRSLSQQYNKAKCHNPYFSRRFFAILEKKRKRQMTVKSQSLFQQKVLCNVLYGVRESSNSMSQSLFQQKVLCNINNRHIETTIKNVTILILVEGSLQYVWWSDMEYDNNTSQSLFQQKVLCNFNPIDRSYRKYKSQSLFQQKVLCNY